MEAKEESGKRSEMAEVRSEVPRRAEERQKLEGKPQRQRLLLGINDNFTGKKEADLLLASVDSAGGESSMRKEAEEEDDWVKRPEESEESYMKRLRVPSVLKPKESAMDQEVITDNKEDLEQVFKDKLDILDLEEDSNGTTESAAGPNSVTIRDDHVDRGKSALAKKTAEEEAEDYALFRNDWESDCCDNCDHFEHITVLSSMQFTQYTPGIVPYDGVETLQIFSMELKLTDDNAGGFEFPLSLYGMVAVRDSLDSLEIGFRPEILNKELLLPSNFVYGGLVSCTPIPRTTADSGVNQKIVLTESKGRKMPQGDGGYLHLSRQVISVECGGGLDVVIQAYKKSGAVAAEGHFHFKAQNCQMSRLQCVIGRTQVTVAVAWSVVPTDMDDVVFNL